tara:strand:+ start:25827 stop:26051 length:225 start_codon:yes stop_codon:yes gene_type:complete
MTIEITADMAGVVYEVLVSEGQAVAEGEQVVVLEAMKMESPVASPTAGVVREIAVAEGGAVEVGDVLLTIDPES